MTTPVAHQMDATERRWRLDFANAHDSIPGTWLVQGTDPDGTKWTCIDSAHRDAPLMRMYKSLALVGFARGWID